MAVYNHGRELIPSAVSASSCSKEISMKVVNAAVVEFSPVLYSREGIIETVVQHKIHELGRHSHPARKRHPMMGAPRHDG